MGKFCTNCGAQLEEKQEKCNYCGKVLNVNATSQETQQVNQPQQQTQYQNNMNANSTMQPKSKLCAGLLGIFLGAFGVHNFYLGYTGKAVAQLLISVLSCCMLSGISSIWGLIEGIMILTGSINTDGKGNPLGE